MRESYAAQIADTLAYLASDDAAAGIGRDAYWPKWNTPWWHLLLLHEMGLTEQIPVDRLTQLGEQARRQYLPFFPVRAEELPPGIDARRQIACHCALGCLYRLLHARGLDPDIFLPFARDWFVRYQLPDGGWNCDEAVYVKPVPKSSIVSTLPVLEAMLYCLRDGPRPAEWEAIDRGAEYLIGHRLVRRQSDPSRIIDPNWLNVRFPRFYEYDFLRGAAWLVDWAAARRRSLPPDLLREVAGRLAACCDPRTNVPVIGFCDLLQNSNYAPDSEGTWKVVKPPTSFSLLDAVSRPGTPVPALRATAERVRAACAAAG